ncbi:class I SAM-dependent methyltransferase [Jonesiaceae bacterium BS-20]|uniref:Class I SAM-dependent methyltransferase n=1 Tax=Jonesiaceae bacterium BS-20 TaxID=3120821 RepID=A0AAU7DZS8_9MICO
MGKHGGFGQIRFTEVDGKDAIAAGRTWWDANASEYLAENGAFLGLDHFVWGPEGLTEAQAQLLGPTSELAGKQILEIGSGAAQCSRWLATQGAHPVASDISHGMLKNSIDIDRALDGTSSFSDATGKRAAKRKAPASKVASNGVVANSRVSTTTGAIAPDIPTAIPVIQADARKLPFGLESFDAVFTSFGAIPFVPDAELIHHEAFRVLKPGGRWVFSVTHPARWMFPDDPTMHGTSIIRSYFATEPYVEFDRSGKVEYAEFHRTTGQHVRQVVGAGFNIIDLVEPEWPAENTNVWGGWGPERGALLPGTLIVVCEKPLV